MLRGLADPRRFALPVLLFMASVLPPQAFAQAGATARDPLVDAREARHWIARIHDAASQRNFQGTFVVMTGGSVSSSRIFHFCDGGNQYERIESLDGQMRQVFRHNELVHSLWPQHRTAVVETRYTQGEFPSLLSAGAERIVQFYDVRPRGEGRVAGHEADVLTLQPRDGYRYGYRLWAEKSTGLLLRAEVVDERDTVLEVSAFSDLSINVKAKPEQVLQPMRRLEGYAVQRPQIEVIDLAREGWTLRQAPPGFKHVVTVRRMLTRSLRGTAPADTAPPAVLQTIYSDGLTHVSIFIEAATPENPRREALMSLGATQTLVHRVGDWWLTLIGDVPALTLRTFAESMEPRR
jgi:sigma-E factor negative regulatory protein RseB